MNILSNNQSYIISNDIAKKIIRDFKSEIKENRGPIQKLNQMDYEYNKKVIYVDKLIDAVNLYDRENVVQKNTENIVVAYYGDPYVTIQIILSALFNCQRVNLVIDEMCFGVNKLIIELYKEILKEYRIKDIISLSSYLKKKDLEQNKGIIDKVYCLGNKNLFNVYRDIKDLEITYIPFNNIDIFCEDEDLYEMAEDIFNVCFECGIEAEIFDDIDFNEAINVLNNYGENYCSVILTRNKEYMKRFKNEVKSKFIFVNENPFSNYEIYRIPKIFG